MSARRKPEYGPPMPNPLLVGLRTRLERSDDPVDVVAAALGLRDARPILPMGGGMAIDAHARPYAEDVVEALKLRGMLMPPVGQLELVVL